MASDQKLVEEIQTRYILHWNYRGFTQWPEELLQYGHHIEEIYFKENGLLEFPNNLNQFMPNLKQLYLYGNQLKMLPESIGDLIHLEILDLSHNFISELPKTIGKLQHLQVLDVSHNLIMNLPNEIGNLENLSSLIIVKNMLQNLPKSIKNCSNLQTLHLNGNQLKTLNPELSKCYSLKDLYLERNFIKEIPEELTQLRHLRHLSISGNDLHNLPILPFVSHVRISFDENPDLCEIPFIFGCQQNQLKSIRTSNSRVLWNFPIKGCFKSKLDNNKSIIKHMKIPSLSEFSLRKVYLMCYELQVSRQNWSFRRKPRCSTAFGRKILDFKSECLPRHLVFVLRKGPKTFCNYCCEPIFHEGLFEKKSVTLLLKDEPEVQPQVVMHFCSHFCYTFSSKLLLSQ